MPSSATDSNASASPREVHVTASLTVGIRVPFELFEAGASSLRRGVDAIASAGIDRLCIGDHVSFKGGQGYDGLVQATALAALTDLEVQTSIYLLALRHPVTVARQLSTLSLIAPGRFLFGIGVGGEDPNEYLACGVDPATRGRRMDESIDIVRALLEGESVTRSGGFFDMHDVMVTPAPTVAIPFVVGGRSDAALRRAGQRGEGYLALWISPERFSSSIKTVEHHAAEAGRSDVTWRHGLHVWCGFGATKQQGRDHVATTMESLYKTPFEKFEHWCPYGTPADVASFLVDYAGRGCREFNLIPNAANSREAIESVAEVRRLLRAH